MGVCMANTKKTTKETAKPEVAEKKKYYWVEEDSKVIRSRLNRVTGQLKGIVNMIEEGRPYEDVLIQLSSSYKSIRSVTNMILCNHLIDCVKKSVTKGEYDVLEEAMEIFKRYQ